MDFSCRSYQKELLDRDDIPFADIERNMQELDFINTYLGGHAITLAGIKKMIGKELPEKKSWLICEIGCGGGDNIRAVHRWCSKQGIHASFVGVDINPECIKVAARKLRSIPCELIAADYKLARFNSKPDIVFSSLFCHHFTNGELTGMLHWMQQHATSGFFINDLHRHPLAYYSIKALTALFSSSYLVKNDAPLSVQRGFKSREWKELLHAAGIHSYQVSWKWAFRYLVTVQTNQVYPNAVDKL
ncbi:MAG: methyltransferase domain-containing protein [Williamsia sp.]|nr:methyltransferase domain-containing protein [Williamsia sp.]